MDEDYQIIDSQVSEFSMSEPNMKQQAVALLLKHIEAFTKEDIELLKEYINAIYRRRWLTTPLPSDYKRKLNTVYSYGLRLNIVYNLFNIVRNLKAGKNIQSITISLMSLISSLL